MITTHVAGGACAALVRLNPPLAGQMLVEASSPSLPVRAAQYVRMSTEHQQYSTENQSDAILRYASTHGMEIVRTYSDAGKSGLSLSGRAGLRDLLKDVEGGNADFSDILVYDVSRWGRFQDADESAYYEYVCKRSKVRVHYCAEQFENDGSLPSSILKTIKRTMAGEYSRELSVKVFAGQCKLIELGFRQGGPAGYGLRRQLIDREGNPKEILSRGEQKSIQTDRVILIPGPEDEVTVIREIYDLFTKQRKTEQEIAFLLNSKGLLTDLRRPWTRGTVHQILTNPKYAGGNVYNRRSFKLKRKRVNNPPEMWIRRDDAFKPVIAPTQFADAMSLIQSRSIHLNNDQLLERLRGLLVRVGTLSGILIDEAEDMPSSTCYRCRFGSLIRAYALIGYTPSRDFSYIETNRGLREYHARMVRDIIAELRSIGTRVEQDPDTDLLILNREFTASLVLARCRQTVAGSHRWLIRLDNSLKPDVTIAARLSPGNQGILDYYLFPSMDDLAEKLRLAPANGILLDVYRFKDLDVFKSMARRVPIKEAA
ncbi:MAG TPA: recombinase family protein [Nitrospira sp.]|nr:recombinase family protein [Nitrospira sp.]